MVISSRFPTAAQRGGLAKRTLIYVASFGVGSLAIAGILSLAAVSIAEGLLPAPPSPAAPAKTVEPAGTASPVDKRPTRRAPSVRPRTKKAPSPLKETGRSPSPASPQKGGYSL